MAANLRTPSNLDDLFPGQHTLIRHVVTSRRCRFVCRAATLGCLVHLRLLEATGQLSLAGAQSGCPYMVLTRSASPANMQGMAHSFLVFDFGGNEEAAQQARHRIDGWKQGFRLDKKLQVKFERKETEAQTDERLPRRQRPQNPAQRGRPSRAQNQNPARRAKLEDRTDRGRTAAQIRLIVRLDFSDHEKLSHQRWIERIPTEEPFKDAHPKVVRAGEPEFKAISDLFDSLD